MNLNQEKSTGHGGARPGAGRPRGSKGRRTEDLEAMLQRMGCHPVEILARIAMNYKEGLGEEDDIAIALRQKAASDLMPYVAPKLRTSQVEFTDRREDQRLIVNVSSELAAKLKRDAGESIHCVGYDEIASKE